MSDLSFTWRADGSLVFHFKGEDYATTPQEAEKLLGYIPGDDSPSALDLKAKLTEHKPT
jgi:hypothetical protein